jgi:hypothetical protein
MICHYVGSANTLVRHDRLNLPAVATTTTVAATAAAAGATVTTAAVRHDVC